MQRHAWRNTLRPNLGPDGALDNVGVELDETVGQEAFEDFAPGDGIAYRLGQLRLARDARQGLLPQCEQSGDDRCRDSLPRGGSRLGILTRNIRFDLPEVRHPLDVTVATCESPAAWSS